MRGEDIPCHHQVLLVLMGKQQHPFNLTRVCASSEVGGINAITVACA